MENRGVTFKLSQEVNDLDKSLRQRNQLADTMMVLFIEELYHSINLQTGFSDFLDGIHDLMRHKLSPSYSSSSRSIAHYSKYQF